MSLTRLLLLDLKSLIVEKKVWIKLNIGWKDFTLEVKVSTHDLRIILLNFLKIILRLQVLKAIWTTRGLHKSIKSIQNMLRLIVIWGVMVILLKSWFRWSLKTFCMKLWRRIVDEEIMFEFILQKDQRFMISISQVQDLTTSFYINVFSQMR